MHGDVPLAAPGSTILGVYLNLLGHGVGWPSPEGGAGRLTAALVGICESLAGSCARAPRSCRSPPAAARVSGVRLAGGERLAGRM